MPRKTIKGERAMIVSGAHDPSRVEFVWEPMPSQVKVLLSPAYEIMSGGSRGGGKALESTTYVLTDSGWKQAYQVSYTDKLVSVDGAYTSVEGIYPQGCRPMYRIEFDDGPSVVCDAEHRWLVYSGNHGKRDGWLVKTTEQIFNSKDTWYIPTMSAPAPGLPYDGPDPYVIGQLLGDGTMSSQYPIVYTPDEETRDYLVNKHGWRWGQYKPNVFQVGCSAAQAGMWQDFLGRKIGAQKRIPQVLLDAEPSARLAVLQGLMDSDGSAEKNGGCRFFSISEHLASQVQYLARSLGGKATMRWVDKKSGKGGTDGYFRVNIVTGGKFCPFRLKRKADRAKCSKGANRRIMSITRVEDAPAVCFKVSHPSSLFVVQDFIVTHNTDVGIAFMAAGNQAYGYPEFDENGEPIPVNISYLYHPNYSGLVIRKNANDHRDWIERAKFFYDRLGGEWFKSEMTFRFESGARLIVGHLAEEDSWEKYRGHEYQRINMEEITQIAEEKQYLLLRSSCRSKYPELKCQIFLSTNPIGPGLFWVKNRFVQINDEGGNRILPESVFYEERPKDRKQRSRYVVVPNNPRTIEKLHRQGKLTRTFIPMWLKDNRYLMTDEIYRANLEELPESERRAMLDGDWDAMTGGRYFEEFREKPLTGEPPEACHVIDPVKMEPWWDRWGGLDWGYAHETACYGVFRNEDDSRVHAYKELVASQIEPFELGVMVAKLFEPDLIDSPSGMMPLYISKDAFDQRRGSNEPTIADLIAAGIQEHFGPGGCLVPHHMDEGQLESFYASGRKSQLRLVLHKVDTSPGSRIAAAQYIRSQFRWWPVRKDTERETFDERIANEILKNEGIERYKRYTDRTLGGDDKEVLPKLRIWRTCPKLIEQIPQIQRDENNLEDYDTKKGKWDRYDAFRYAVYNHTLQTGARMPKEVWIDRFVKEQLGNRPAGWQAEHWARQRAETAWKQRFAGSSRIPIPGSRRARRR